MIKLELVIECPGYNLDTYTKIQEQLNSNVANLIRNEVKKVTLPNGYHINSEINVDGHVQIVPIPYRISQ